MRTVYLSASGINGIAKQIKNIIGGEFGDQWGEEILKLDNDLAKGTIRFLRFEWGVNLIDFDVTFTDNIMFVWDTENYNPINFLFCIKGQCSHGFNVSENLRPIEQFQSVIIANKEDGKNYFLFQKDTKHETNLIQVVRKRFLKKKVNNVSLLNKELYEVFMDTDYENRYSYYGKVDFEIYDQIRGLRKLKYRGMTRILQLEAKVYMVLSLHIQKHFEDVNKENDKSPLNKTELKKVKEMAKKIIKEPAESYNLQDISNETQLSQAKLQKGFKFLFNRTVTEFVRYIRLKAAKELMNTTDLNISQIVYQIGFTSRSYFSKIFKDQYDITPNKYKKQVSRNIYA